MNHRQAVKILKKLFGEECWYQPATIDRTFRYAFREKSGISVKWAMSFLEFMIQGHQWNPATGRQMAGGSFLSSITHDPEAEAALVKYLRRLGISDEALTSGYCRPATLGWNNS